ncbi:C-C motif chemokine 24 [Fukomys damarensis]|uniref:C-C motif chemokine 24 n=1 Tax=Fukomys damarensis TaxID=885580 RepID=A0A091EIZ7_FUKDA|nr:C-C motif chemokine 24 [Fukomys damarensis]KFO35486.1 C-C motif chemokine 24 [Fukomys damarensis]
MAGSETIAASLLLLALCSHCIMPTDSVVIPSSCCINFVSKKIPESRVASYQLSSRSVCSKAGVIFTTRSGQKFCGDPKQPWVQRYMRNLDAKRKQLSPQVRAVGGKVPVHRCRSSSTTL